MNWHKANQALGNIERLMQVFETSGNLSSIERDLLLRRIQDLYEIVLRSEESEVKSTKTVKTTPKPIVQTPPVVEKPKVEPKIELPKEEIREEKPAIKVPEPIEVPKVETPTVQKPKVEVTKPPISRPEKPVIEQPPYQEPYKEPHQKTHQEPNVMNQFDDEESEIIETLFEFKTASDLSEKLSASPIRDLTTSMSINERFITISELFKGNKSKYDEAIHELNSFNNFEQAKSYILNHLIGEYNWTKKKKIKSAKAFIKKVRRRYL